MLPENQRKVDVPFKEINNLIVVPVILNNQLPLQFILDTGVRTSILTDRVYGDLLNMDYIRKFTLKGAGAFQLVEAYVASDVSLSLPGVESSGLSIFVLERDYLDLGSQLGIKVDGILGYEFFSRFVVKIDYEKDVLTIYNPKFFKAPRGYQKMPLKIENTKPYINCFIQERPGSKKKSVSLMVDTGASHALLLHQDDKNERFDLPEETIFTNLGRGLGGEVNGYIGRIVSLQLNKFDFNNILASYPLDSSYGNISDWNDRGGTVGGNLLNRFKVVLDYSGEAIYLKRDVRYKDPFIFSKTGLELAAKGVALDRFVVLNVLEDSPACEAGIKVGDEIVKINGSNASSLTLGDILNIFGKRDGKKIRMVMKREGKEYKVVFRLKDVI